MEPTDPDQEEVIKQEEFAELKRDKKDAEEEIKDKKVSIYALICFCVINTLLNYSVLQNPKS